MSAEDTLRGPGFARLFRLARQRLEREPDAVAYGRASLSQATDEERARVGGLLGVRFRGATVTVELAAVDDALHKSTGRGLVAWLAKLGGPLRDRPAEDARDEALRTAALEALRARPFANEPWFGAWLDDLRQGTLTRLLSASALDDLRLAADILEALPVDGAAMPVFASRYAGGTKALRGTRLERLVLRALSYREGVAPPKNAAASRALWERFGVVLDDLAATVLALNLPAVGTGLVDDRLRAYAAAGVPVRLTLHELTIAPPTLRADAPVFVCENPAVLRMAAERLGPRSAPLVVTEGQPSSAFWRLARRFGPDVRARADLDTDGLRIAGRVIGELKASPWRFDAATYRATNGKNKPLPQRLPSTPWDPELARAMAGGVRVEEEELLDVLLADLAARG